MRLALALSLFLLTFVDMVLGAPADIRIGAIIPLSGDLSALGKKLQDGILMASEKHGARVLFEDGALSPSQALSAFQKLNKTDHVQFVVGPFGPDQTLVVAPAAAKAGALLVAVALCEPRFEAFANVFCIFPKSADQIQPLIEMLNDPAIEKVAYLGEELQGFEDYRNRIRTAVQSRHKQLVLDETFQSKDLDFRSILTKLKSTGVDVLAIGGANMSAVASGFRQAKELGIDPKVRWYLSEHDKAFFAANQELLEGAYGLAIPPMTEEFKKSFHAKFNYEPDLYSSLAYDGTEALLQAIEADPTSPVSEVQQRLSSVRFKNTATPGFKFDPKRMVDAPVALTEIRGGAIAFVK